MRRDRAPGLSRGKIPAPDRGCRAPTAHPGEMGRDVLLRAADQPRFDQRLMVWAPMAGLPARSADEPSGPLGSPMQVPCQRAQEMPRYPKHATPFGLIRPIASAFLLSALVFAAEPVLARPADAAWCTLSGNLSSTQ